MKYEFINKAVYFESGILAIADLHIGFEASLIKSGLQIPKKEKQDIINDLKEIFSILKKTKKKIKEFIIVGDIKELFGGFSLDEWKDVKEVLDFIKSFNVEVVLIRGNHDKYLDALEREYDVRDFYVKDGIGFFHGDRIFKEMFSKKIKTLVIGHIHPIVYLKEDIKQESYKCFLVGKYKGKKLVILPGFTPMKENGFDVEEGKILGNLKLDKFKVFIWDNEEKKVLEFGEVGKLNN